MSNFNYEWWTVDIQSECGTITWEFKAKSKDNAIKQIEKTVAYTNSDENANKDMWHREPKIVRVFWDTLKLDRIGYQRLS